MNAPTSIAADPVAHSSERAAAPVPAADIDRSCRYPVLMLLSASVGWLMVGSVLGLLGAIKMHAGGFLAQWDWLTFGRVFPACQSALVYGFASQAALGVILWMMARLSRTTLLGSTAILLAGFFWNVAVLLGVLGILNGGNSGFPWFEMPALTGPVLFVAYVLFAFWALATFHVRRERELYVSQWYLFAAILWFAWIFSTAQLLLHFFPVRGVVQAVVNGWYAHNLLGLWLGGVGLAVIYYFIPKCLGRPLHSRYLAVFGFWSLLVFGSWGGLQPGTPVPKWISSLCTVMTVLTLIPVAATAMNWHLTSAGAYRQFAKNPVLRFVLFAAACYVLSSVLAAAFSLRTLGSLTQFTVANLSLSHLVLFGFIGMALFGALYYIIPRLTETAWPSGKLIDLHFWGLAGGVAASVLALLLGGFLQGMDLNTAEVPPLLIVKRTMPFLGLSTLGMLLILAANLALAINLGKMLAACCACCLPGKPNNRS